MMSKLTGDFAYLASFKAIGIVSHMLMFPYLLKYLGFEQYGEFLLINLFIGIGMMIDAGLLDSLTQRIAAKSIHIRLERQITFTSVLVISVLHVVVFLVFQSLGLFSYLKGLTMTTIIAMIIVLSWYSVYQRAILRGFQNHKVVAKAGIIGKIISTLFCVLGVQFEQSYEILIVLFHLDKVILLILQARFIPEIVLPSFRWSNEVKAFYRFGSGIFLAQLAVIFEYQIDGFLIKIFDTNKGLVHYNGINIFFRVSQQIIGIIGIIVTPLLASSLLENYSALTRRNVRIQSYLSSALSIIMLIACPFLLQYLGINEDNTRLVAKMYIFYFSILFCGASLGQSLISQGESKILAKYASYSAFLNFSFSLILSQFIGWEAPIIGTITSGLVILPFAWRSYCSRIGLAFSDFIKIILIPLSCALTVLIVAIIFSNMWILGTIGTMILFLLVIIYARLEFNFSIW